MRTVWDSLKVVLTRLCDEQPEVLFGYPDPRVDEYRRPPFCVRLAPWAARTAEELHARFGSDVRLTVGLLPYPPRETAELIVPAFEDTSHSDDLGVELDGPLSIRSGHTGRHGLRVTNRAGASVTVRTNGKLTAVVVDPGTDRAVGGFAGAQRQPLVRFPIRGGATRVIPLLVGTASFDPALGYAIPPGEWALRAVVALEDGRRLLTPALPFTVSE
ncbi:hypothetical protein [Prauserella flavalba]|uniref:hypothetical protein n=1 Tax=Prauserella flavalba TaxID=1477506 RepID=UPI0036EBF712